MGKDDNEVYLWLSELPPYMKAAIDRRPTFDWISNRFAVWADLIIKEGLMTHEIEIEIAAFMLSGKGDE